MDEAPDPLDLPTQVGASIAASPVHGGLPRHIDDYEVLEQVASGGMGVVYRARQKSLDRIVALKVLHRAGDRHDTLIREAAAAGQLDHPGIVPVFEVGCYAGTSYFTMAMVEGKSLAQLLAQGPLPVETAARYIAQVARALQYAHEHGVVHCDIKPANILMDQGGHARVTDFGIARTRRSAGDATIVGGTPYFMAPEQADPARGTVGPATDIYSLGAVLFAALTGRPPFFAATAAEATAQLLTFDAPSPRQLNRSVPRELEIITWHCLRKEPRYRFRTAGEVAEDLERFLRGQPIRARPHHWLLRWQMVVREHVVLASVSGIASLGLIVLCLLLTWLMYRARSRNAELQFEVDDLRTVLRLERELRVKTLGLASDDAKRARSEDAQRLLALARGFVERDPAVAILLALRAGEVSNDLDAETATLLRQLSQADETTANSELIEHARRWAGRSLTERERERFDIPTESEQTSVPTPSSEIP